MFNTEVRDVILRDINQPIECSIQQKNNRRLLKNILLEGPEKCASKGSFKLYKYKKVVNSMLTLFNLYHSGFYFQVPEPYKHSKRGTKLYEKLGNSGVLGVVIEGYIKPWDLNSLINSINQLNRLPRESLPKDLKKALKRINKEELVNLTIEETEEYQGIKSYKKQKEDEDSPNNNN